METTNAKTYENLIGELNSLGFTAFGFFRLEPGNGNENNSNGGPTLGLLLGNAGPGMWQVFSHSQIYRSDRPDPLNRWTENVLNQVAVGFATKVIFPFGERLWPFQQFAVGAMGLKPSPLGLLIHPEYGLWHAYRGALLVSPGDPLYERFEREFINQVPVGPHPCDNCAGRPCMRACPVAAFGDGGLEVEKCTLHLDSNSAPDCINLGCHARNACPVGLDYRYATEQLAFHMQAFRRSRA